MLQRNIVTERSCNTDTFAQGRVDHLQLRCQQQRHASVEYVFSMNGVKYPSLATEACRSCWVPSSRPVSQQRKYSSIGDEALDAAKR